MSRLADWDYEKAIAGGKIVTQDGTPLRIVCWDFTGDDFYNMLGVLESITDGTKVVTPVKCNRKGFYENPFGVTQPMYLLAEEPEYTEFEKALSEHLNLEHLSPDAQDKYIKETAAKLLEIAKKETKAENFAPKNFSFYDTVMYNNVLISLHRHKEEKEWVTNIPKKFRELEEKYISLACVEWKKTPPEKDDNSPYFLLFKGTGLIETAGFYSPETKNFTIWEDGGSYQVNLMDDNLIGWLNYNDLRLIPKQ